MSDPRAAAALRAQLFQLLDAFLIWVVSLAARNLVAPVSGEAQT